MLENADTIKEDKETSVDGSKQVDLNVNSENTTYVLLYHHQNAWRNHDIDSKSRSLKIWHSSNIWEQ
jgi:hypothetical protein